MLGVTDMHINSNTTKSRGSVDSNSSHPIVNMHEQPLHNNGDHVIFTFRSSVGPSDTDVNMHRLQYWKYFNTELTSSVWHVLNICTLVHPVFKGLVAKLTLAMQIDIDAQLMTRRQVMQHCISSKPYLIRLFGKIGLCTPSLCGGNPLNWTKQLPSASSHALTPYNCNTMALLCLWTAVIGGRHIRLIMCDLVCRSYSTQVNRPILWPGTCTGFSFNNTVGGFPFFSFHVGMEPTQLIPTAAHISV